MKAQIFLDGITFRQNAMLEFENNSIVVFVGPNNCGKSLTLRELYGSLKNTATKNLIVESVHLKKKGNEEDLLAELKERKLGNQYYYLDRSRGGHSVNAEQLLSSWRNQRNGADLLALFFVKFLSTSDRLQLVNPAEGLDILNTLPSLPIQHLKADEELESKFSSYFKKAFGEEIIVNHGTPNNITLHVGTRPTTDVKKDRVSKAYLTELNERPLLQQQGDGMKSFAGVFLTLFVFNYSITLIDEPEAFLHPPQAKLLGQMIAHDLGTDKQLFISTHSSDVLKGLLEGGSERLHILRIQREDNKNLFSQLANNDIKSVWSDPIFRHSNILDGLFHKMVVLCESESDCRFYSAILAAIVEQEELSAPDILFIDTGGKHRYPIAVNALQKLRVPLKIIGDFDFYHEQSPLKEIFELMGGNWEEISKDFKIVKLSVDNRRPQLNKQIVAEQINAVLSAVKDENVPDDSIKAIKSILKKSSSWMEAKIAGKAILTAGDATTSFINIQSKLAAVGIYILEMGELEAFDKTVGGHGPKWVNAVLQKNLLTSPELQQARQFVKEKILT